MVLEGPSTDDTESVSGVPPLCLRTNPVDRWSQFSVVPTGSRSKDVDDLPTGCPQPGRRTTGKGVRRVTVLDRPSVHSFLGPFVGSVSES